MKGLCPNQNPHETLANNLLLQNSLYPEAVSAKTWPEEDLEKGEKQITRKTTRKTKALRLNKAVFSCPVKYSTHQTALLSVEIWY